MRTRLAAIAAAALLTVTMAACSSDSGGDAANAGAGSAGTANAGWSQVSDAAGGDAAAEPEAEPESEAGSDDAGAGSEAESGSDTAADDVEAGSGEDAAATGGDTREVLKTFYHDITTLPERVESEGAITDAEGEAMLGPLQAIGDDNLPGMVGRILPILKHDIDAATVSDSAAEVEEYFDRGAHKTAMEELVNSTRMTCGLPDTWPEDI